MINLFRRSRSAVRRSGLDVGLTVLEQRDMLSTTVTAPPVNLSTATIDSLAQSLVNFETHYNAANATADLKQMANALNQDINNILNHPGHDIALDNALLQIEVDAVAVVDQAILDLSPPTAGNPTILA